MPAFIDLPSGPIRDRPLVIAGWVASTSNNPEVTLRVEGRTVPFVFCSRPDVRQALSRQEYQFTSGVTATVDENGLGSTSPVTIELSCDGQITRKTCAWAVANPSMTEGDTGRTAGASVPALLRDEARSWCLAHLSCPCCRGTASQLDIGAAAITCTACAAVFPQRSAALNLLPSPGAASAALEPSGNVSSNPYTPDALAMIDRATGGGGWVLDCGAGSRPERLRHVVNLEITDYPFTDVLGIGESLPFADASFEAVLSLAVLEHVRDPFSCAREILRVLKPGGEVLADVPLLQPVHGYPNHYYNMTQAGLINLFGDDAEILERKVPPHGHPIFAVQWLLGAYLAALPEPSRHEFGARTLLDVASLSPHGFLADPAASSLSADQQETIACLNSVRFRKRAG